MITVREMCPGKNGSRETELCLCDSNTPDLNCLPHGTDGFLQILTNSIYP